MVVVEDGCTAHCELYRIGAKQFRDKADEGEIEGADDGDAAPAAADRSGCRRPFHERSPAKTPGGGGRLRGERFGLILFNR